MSMLWLGHEIRIWTILHLYDISQCRVWNIGLKKSQRKAKTHTKGSSESHFMKTTLHSRCIISAALGWNSRSNLCPVTYATNSKAEYFNEYLFSATTSICTAPPTIAHGSLTTTAAASYNFRDTVSYTCDSASGYEFADQYDGIECLLNKTWTEAPTCNRKYERSR